MRVYFDTETHPFRPGRMAPPVVCVQFCVDGGPAQIVVKPDIYPTVRGWLEAGALTVGHNVSYDWAALVSDYPDLTPLVWQAYRSDLVADTMIRQKLSDIGRSRYRTRQYNLGSVSAIHGGPTLNKDDPWRTRYAELEDVPLAQWPQEALSYALLDAEATRAAYLGQEARYDPALLVDGASQARKFWALQLASVWGIRTSARGVASLREGVEARIAELQGLLTTPLGCGCDVVAWKPEDAGEDCPWCGNKVVGGLLRPNGTRDTKAAKEHMRRVCEELGLPLAKTKGDDISLSNDVCDATQDVLLKTYAEYSSLKKTLSNDVKAWEQGIVLPCHPHFDLADTGRITAAKPNSTNPRRMPGVRECIVPRDFDAKWYSVLDAQKKAS